MRSRTITFIDLISRYGFLVNGDYWVVGRRDSYDTDDEMYDIYFISNGRYEYLSSETLDTNNQPARIIFDRLGL